MTTVTLQCGKLKVALKVPTEALLMLLLLLL